MGVGARNIRILSTCALLAIGTATAAEWDVDAGASHAEFRVRFIGVLPISGNFKDFKGAIEPAGGGQLRVHALIQSASLHMSTDRAERWARSEEFFDSARYPQIEYVSEPFEPQRLELGGRVEGRLTLRGITDAAAIDIHPVDCLLAEQKPCIVDAAAGVTRAAFGMKTRRGLISDGVSLNFHIVARPSAPAGEQVR